MARVMPFKSTLPRPGNAVHVAIGEPLELEHITCRCGAPGACTGAATQADGQADTVVGMAVPVIAHK
jgi:hypothetical protein